MSYQIIKQPGGELAVFSSVTETIVLWDATAEEVVEWFVDAAMKKAKREAERVVEVVLHGQTRDIYHQFTMSWEEALKSDEKRGGEAWGEFAAETKEQG